MFIIIFILILSILVLVHEFGHFIAAKRNGVLVEEFGLGFPPRIFGKKVGETIYSINLLPLGGFVKVYGEEYHEVRSNIDPRLRERGFVYKSPWQKAVILVAGIVNNFLLGWILISFLFTQGVPTPTNQVVAEQVQANSPAQKAGIANNDVLVKAIKDNREYPFTSTTDLINVTKKFGNEPISLVIKHNGQEQTVIVTPRKNPPPGQGSLGVVVTSFINKKYPWYQAPFYGLKEAANISYHIVAELGKTLFQLATFQSPKVDVTGPIGIAQFTGEAIKLGNNAVLELMALLSLNLAVINILPFPALDGGRLAFVIYEWVTKKRIHHDIERYFNLAGFAILIGLTILISIHDIVKLIHK